MKSASLRHSLRRFASVRGQSVIEFALILPFLLLIVFGITEFGRALMTANILTQAAREGARVAAVGADSTDAVDRVTDVLTAANVSVGTIDVAGPDANRVIEVTVTSPFNVIPTGTFFPMSGTITLTGRAVMRFEG